LEIFKKECCNVCQSKDFEEIHQEPIRCIAGLGRIDYLNCIVICRNCGFVFKNPLPTKRELINYYSNCSIHDSFGYDENRMVNIYASLQSHFPDGFRGRLLEIGCANGHLLKVFRDQGWQVAGIDPNPASQEAALIEHDLVIMRGEFDVSLFLGQEPYDLIILYDVIEHLIEPDRLISDLTELLTENGLLYLVTPNILCPYVDLGYFSFEHLSFFSPKTLSWLLAQSGFQAIEIDPAEKISSVWKRSKMAFEFKSDYLQVSASVKGYQEKFNTRMELIEKKISAAISLMPSERLAVWGAGAHTGQLLEMTELGELPLYGFFDSDVKKHGTTLNGLPIMEFPSDPDVLVDKIDGILISSKAFEDAIYQSICHLEEKGIRIFTLYQP
jgi:SAM-dependent methyltransferase